jgi:hypothetical protein
MAARITDGEYHALSQLRYLIRRFLQEGDATARQAGLEPQQYLLLLAIRGLEPGQEASIRALVESIRKLLESRPMTAPPKRRSA